MSHLSDTSLRESSADEPTPKLSRLLWWLQPKVALPLLLFMLILISPLMYRAHSINSVPDIAEPFDLYAFGAVDIAPADNAMTQYTAAVGRYVDAGFTSIPSSDSEKAFEFGWEQTSEPLRKWHAANEPALAEWRKGTEQTQSVLVQPKDMKIDMPLDVIQSLRFMSRLALLKADHCLAEGDIESAWDWHRAALRCSQHVSQNGVLIQRLIGMSFFQQAAKGITRWAEDPRVTAVQLQTALEDIRAADKLATPNSDALKCEYLVLVELLGRDRLDEFVSSPRRMSPALFRTQTFLLGDPEYSRRLLRHFFDNWLSECDKPRWQQSPMAPGHSYRGHPCELASARHQCAIHGSEFCQGVSPRLESIERCLSTCGRARVGSEVGIGLPDLLPIAGRLARETRRPDAGHPLGIALRSVGDDWRDFLDEARWR